MSAGRHQTDDKKQSESISRRPVHSSSELAINGRLSVSLLKSCLYLLEYRSVNRRLSPNALLSTVLACIEQWTWILYTMDRTESDYYRILFPTAGLIGNLVFREWMSNNFHQPNDRPVSYRIELIGKLFKTKIGYPPSDLCSSHLESIGFCCVISTDNNNWQLIEMKLLTTFVFVQGPTLLAQHHSHALTHHVRHGRPALDRHGHSAGACAPFISNSSPLIIIKKKKTFISWY